ncbi:N-formylglutamate amidohydrolase [Sphingomonas solaris]|uniref:N-formylglutamate amidohydrolase n=1 Tax=Alterirhizorhabdus solaris TaxID=2529389 RepID=A0A558R3Y0_9SPHN|nr:N-formylglutamate amidohydrolase [Sphingomonas solaris]TVV74052.1 N-formylglutamate amidohydrolase [Sphingomonas solaris]
MASPEYPGRQADPANGPGLLATDDPAPVAILNPAASSPFLLIGDHAGLKIPKSLDSLGVSDADLARHIACDIGVQETGTLLAGDLDACFIHQIYSRLVIDCNRDPTADDAIPARSDGADIPGNHALDAAARATRVAAIHAPYHAAIAAEISRRTAAGRPTVLVALHSFTPVMAGAARPWDIGILYDRGDARFAVAVLAHLAAQTDFVTGDNEPYRMDETDHSVPRHAWTAGLPYVEVEFRQDHLAAPGGPRLWATRFGAALRAALPAAQPAQG